MRCDVARDVECDVAWTFSRLIDSAKNWPELGECILDEVKKKEDLPLYNMSLGQVLSGRSLFLVENGSLYLMVEINGVENDRDNTKRHYILVYKVIIGENILLEILSPKETKKMYDKEHDDPCFWSYPYDN